jgi:hypothetical protein
MCPQKVDRFQYKNLMFAHKQILFLNSFLAMLAEGKQYCNIKIT